VTSYVVGADLGSSAMKTVLVHPRRGVLAVAERTYPMHHPRPGWSENDPDDWYRAFVESVRLVMERAGVDAGAVRAICLVGQRDPAVLLDGAGRVVTPAIHWTDRRDPDETEELFARIGPARITEISGVPPVSGLVLPNLAWTRRHLPDAWRQVRHAVQPKDYVAYRLTGELATDTTSPSRSLLNDWRRGEWSEELCDAAGLDRAIFPPITYRPWEPRAALTSDSARELGVADGTMLVAGGGDDQAATLACGVMEPGDVSISTGSSMCWRVVVDEPRSDPRQLMCLVPHVIPDSFMYELVAVGAGSSLRWFRDTFAGTSDSTGGLRSYEELIGEAAEVPPGADGLMYFPYIATSSLPHPNPNASGVFFGVRLGHSRRHFVRAILEGMAHLYPGFADIVAGGAGSICSLTIVDGEARSAAWNQIKADVLGRAVRTTRFSEGGAVGAAILAGQASGEYSSAAEGVSTLVEFADTFEPDPGRHERYAQLHRRWERVRARLFEAFDAAGGDRS
jgi:xylulokinase